MTDPQEVKPIIAPEETAAHITDLLADSTPPVDNTDPDLGANLSDDGTPKKEPEPGKEKPGEAEPTKPAGEPAGEPAAPVIEPPKPPDAAVKTYEYRGKQYTVEQLVDLGVLEDALQTARQFPTIQGKYQQLLEQTKLGGAPADGSGQQPAQPAQVTAEQILTAYAPVMEQSAKAGYIEKEAYEAFPRLVSALMYHRDLLYDVRQAVTSLMQNAVQAEGVSKRSAFLNFLDSTCDKVAGEGEHFALIKDQKVRKGFYEYLTSLDTPVSAVNDEFIRRQWVAYNSEAVLEAARSNATTKKAADEEARRNAAGEGGGVRPAGPGKVAAKTQDATLLDSFLEGDKRFSTGG
jgi:hypothetical protein